MSLQKAAASGVRWTTVSVVGSTLMETIRLVVLGRLLPPDAFGIMAMILVIIGFGQLFSQMGLVQAVIQRPDPKTGELVSLYWLNLASGLLVYVLLLLSTPLVVKLYSSPALKPLIPYVGLLFILNPLGDLYRAMLEKELRFKPLAGIELTGAFISMVVSILFAVQGFGVWSLVWGQLVTAAFRNLGFFLRGQKLFRPRLHFARSDLRGYLSFGLYETGAMSVNYVNSRIDQLIIGALLGPQALGYYSMAFNLIMRPVQRLNPVLTRVAFPVLARVHGDNERMKRGYFKMLNILTSVNAPILIGIAVVAPVAVPVVLGTKWTPIIPVVQILALFSLLRSLGNAGGSMLLAKGRADISLYWNILLFCFMPGIIFAAAFYGDLITVAWALLALHLGLLFLWYALVVRRLLGSCLKGYLSAFAAPIVLAALMACVVLLFLYTWPLQPSLLTLLLQVMIGMLAYFGLYALFARNTMQELMRLLLNRG